MSNTYSNKPARLLTSIAVDEAINPPHGGYCAGFELDIWRCDALADHIMEWIADYALKEEELSVNHTNMYVRLKQAAIRIYSSTKYKKRGEIGEILLHAICRDYFSTIPIAPRVFYLSSSNDVVKSFDLAHVKYLPNKEFELWLGEAKFYDEPKAAIAAAIASISDHIDQGFLQKEKLILGPQISKDIEHYQEIRDLFSQEASLNKLFRAAVFPICIACNSEAAAKHQDSTPAYIGDVSTELAELNKKIVDSGLHLKIRIRLIYVPLASKDKLASKFDARLKGMQQ